MKREHLEIIAKEIRKCQSVESFVAQAQAFPIKVVIQFIDAARQIDNGDNDLSLVYEIGETLRSRVAQYGDKAYGPSARQLEVIGWAVKLAADTMKYRAKYDSDPLTGEKQ